MRRQVETAGASGICVSSAPAEGRRDSPGARQRSGQSCRDELQFFLISCQPALFLFVLSVSGTFGDTFSQRPVFHLTLETFPFIRTDLLYHYRSGMPNSLFPSRTHLEGEMKVFILDFWMMDDDLPKCSESHLNKTSLTLALILLATALKFQSLMFAHHLSLYLLHLIILIS